MLIVFGVCKVFRGSLASLATHLPNYLGSTWPLVLFIYPDLAILGGLYSPYRGFVLFGSLSKTLLPVRELLWDTLMAMLRIPVIGLRKVR